MEKDLKKLFAEKGLKMTIQRVAILEYLMKTKTHPSAEMIYEHIRKKYPTITLSTVYNTLETLVNKGIIKKIPTFSGISRYDADLEPHIHIVMGSDKNVKIKDIYDQELIHQIREEVAQKLNLNVDDSNIYLIIEDQGQ